MTEEIQEEIKKDDGPRKFRVVVAEQIYYHVDVEAPDSGQARSLAKKIIQESIDRDKYIRELEREATAVFVAPPNFGDPVERLPDEVT